MDITVLAAEVDKSSYLAGDTLEFSLSLASGEVKIGQIANISINIFRAGIARDQLALGFGSAPRLRGDALSVVQKLPDNLPTGLHRIDYAILNGNGGTVSAKQHVVRFDSVWFEIRDPKDNARDAQQLIRAVEHLSQQRQAYAESEILTASAQSASDNSVPYRVIIFGVGCLVHNRQQMPGYSIAPINRGLSHCYLNEIVDSTLRQLRYGPVDFDAATEQAHQQGTPTFFIEFVRVLAIGWQDALDHCVCHAELIFELLGLDRGQKPREFFRMAVNMVTGQRHFTFLTPWYRGNLVSDFNPTSTADFIETAVPNLQSNPFLRLLLRSYAEATSESDWGIQALRYWTVLELLAERKIKDDLTIKHPDGTDILTAKGKQMTTKNKAARVYQFIFSAGCHTCSGSANNGGKTIAYRIGGQAPPANDPDGTEFIPLWDAVQAAYAIRNSVAHEGLFSLDKRPEDTKSEVLAKHLITDLQFDIVRWTRDIAWLATRRELWAAQSAPK